MYDTSGPVGSLWEETAPALEGDDGQLEGDHEADVAIIGAGYTGLSAALTLARDFGSDVVALDAGPIAWGASGRNGGFCTLHPSGLSLNQIVRRYGHDEARHYMAAQIEAIEHARELAATESIDFAPQGDGYFHVAHRPSAFAELEEEGEQLTEWFGIPTRLVGKDQFAEQYYDSTEQFGALHVGVGFGLHPLKFARGLADAARRHGARLHPSSAVVDWQKEGDRHRLMTDKGSVRARKVVIATNGFTRDGLTPALAGRLLPVISNIIVTRPLSEQELAAQRWQTECPCSNTRTLLFYYRLLPDRRFLFGARGDATGRAEDGLAMKSIMMRRFAEVFPAWADVEITHNWRGFVCMTRDLTPAVGIADEDQTVFYGVAYHGDGVAAAPWTGRLLGRLAAGNRPDLDMIPAPMRGPAPPFPFPGLRLWYLRAMLAFYRWQDDR